MPKSEAKLSAPKLVDCRLDMHILSLHKNWPLILFSLDFQHKHIYMINNDNNNSNREKNFANTYVPECALKFPFALMNRIFSHCVIVHRCHFLRVFFFLSLRNAFFPDVVVASGGYVLLCFGVFTW